MSTSQRTTPERRTQAERVADTTSRLLDAAITLMLDEGYAGTTTRRVCELAGVSQGAFSYHFPQRVDLIVAALDRVAEQRLARYQVDVADLPDHFDARTRALLDLVWEDLTSRTFEVWSKAWVAAADDPDLHAGLVPLEERLRRKIETVATSLLLDGIPPREIDAAARRLDLTADDLPTLVGLAISTITGIAFVAAFEPRSRPHPERRMRAQLDLLERMMLG